MNSKKIYTAAIMGAGRIGTGFDAPSSARVLTHVHAIRQSKRLRLAGLVDSDAARGKKEAKRWGTHYYQNIAALFKHEHPDLIVIATPDATHASVLQKLSKLKPKLIICEKPVVTTLRAAAKIKNLRTPVIVNYSRRFDPTVLKVQKAIAHGTYGKVIAAHGIYTGGLLHNGSHAVDLARLLLGKDAAKLTLTAGDARAYSLFELDILTQKARLRFVDGGARLITERPRKDPVYAGFRTLGTPRILQSKLHHALPNLYRHAVAVLDGKEHPHPSLVEALETESNVLLNV